MGAESLAVVAGVILSLLLSYAPGVKDWYDGLEGNNWRLVMLGLLVTVGAFGFEPAFRVLTEWSEPKKTRAGGSQHRPPGQGSA
ncbi:hypothetical protein ACFLV7_01765, partial [Chloroflexota bacterium]